MITGKICFVHLRETDDEGHYQQKGGATIAWIVDEDNGDIIIAKPAKCSSVDTFQKSIGRGIAANNLLSDDALLIIKRETYATLAKTQAAETFQYTDLTPMALRKIQDLVVACIEADVTEVMSSNWFEQIVRSFFALEDNVLYFYGQN